MMMMMTMMSTPPGASSPAVNAPPSTSPTLSPVRKIPGGYGWPLIGPFSDRLNYFWLQGPEEFFRKRMKRYNSTVFRTNVPPSFPFFTGVNPNVIAVLDCKSFAHLFDTEIVEKRNVLVGDWMPSLSYTGGIRVCAYLDTSEPRHSQIKNFSIDILKRSSSIWVETLTSKLDTLWNTLESQLSSSGTTSFLVPVQQFLFSFLTRCLIGADTETSPEIAQSGYVMLDQWLALQLLPTVSINRFQPLEEIFLHSFAYPFFLVSGGYKKLYDFIEKLGEETVERAITEFKLTKDETIHNLLFILGFNAFGGFSVFFPSLFAALSSATPGVQDKLRNEVREKAGSAGLSFQSVREMELVNSFVYETLRLKPPVPSQFARARKDFKLTSHDSAFEVKKGELLCGFQPLVMRDPEVFDDPETFIADRFTKEKGKQLLDYLYWSNGPQSGTTGASNKQCAAKDYVTLTASLFLADMFLRYESVTFSNGEIVAVEKAKK